MFISTRQEQCFVSMPAKNQACSGDEIYHKRRKLYYSCVCVNPFVRRSSPWQTTWFDLNKANTSAERKIQNLCFFQRDLNLITQLIFVFLLRTCTRILLINKWEGESPERGDCSHNFSVSDVRSNDQLFENQDMKRQNIFTTIWNVLSRWLQRELCKEPWAHTLGADNQRIMVEIPKYGMFAAMHWLQSLRGSCVVSSTCAVSL